MTDTIRYVVIKANKIVKSFRGPEALYQHEGTAKRIANQVGDKVYRLDLTDLVCKYDHPRIYCALVFTRTKKEIK